MALMAPMSLKLVWRGPGVHNACHTTLSLQPSSNGDLFLPQRATADFSHYRDHRITRCSTNTVQCFFFKKKDDVKWSQWRHKHGTLSNFKSDWFTHMQHSPESYVENILHNILFICSFIYVFYDLSVFKQVTLCSESCWLRADGPPELRPCP